MQKLIFTNAKIVAMLFTIVTFHSKYSLIQWATRIKVLILSMEISSQVKQVKYKVEFNQQKEIILLAMKK